jgi:hypothetical protein
MGVAPATVYFNILVAMVYKKQLVTLDGRGMLFAIACDVKILAPPALIGEIVETFAEAAWQEARLTTRTVKNVIFVPPFARVRWRQFLDSHPRNPDALLSIHNIPDGSFLENDADPDSFRYWPDDDGINILETPLAPSDFIESYLFGKGIKHRQLLSFIHEVDVAGFPKEAVAMLIGAAS